MTQAVTTLRTVIIYLLTVIFIKLSLSYTMTVQKTHSLELLLIVELCYKKCAAVIVTFLT